MTASELLKQKLVASGYKGYFVAKQLGLTYPGFINKVNDISLFRADEIAVLSELLKLDSQERDAIFFDDFLGDG